MLETLGPVNFSRLMDRLCASYPFPDEEPLSADEISAELERLLADPKILKGCSDQFVDDLKQHIQSICTKV